MPRPTKTGNGGDSSFAITGYESGVFSGTSSGDHGDLYFVVRDTAGTVIWDGTGSTVYSSDGTSWSFDAASLELPTGGYSVTASYTDVHPKNGKVITHTTSSFDFTVETTNSAPTAVDDALATGEDGAVVLDVLANDTDPDTSDILTVTSAAIASGLGTVAVAADGSSITYDPGSAYNSLAVGESATVTVSYQISDGQGGTSTATATVTVVGSNDGPAAVDDAATAVEGTAVVLDVLANDIDPDTSDALTAAIASGPTNGSVTLNADGTLTYTPDAGFTGTDSFTYTVGDGNGGTDTGTATITVDPAADTQAPTGATPDLLAGSDSGLASDDNITGHSVATFRVLLDPSVRAGDTVQLVVNGTKDVSHDILESEISLGYVDLTTTSTTLVQGDNAVAAYFVDPAGNWSETAALAVTLDTVVPTIGTPDLVDSSDTGWSQTDNVTKDSTATFRVALGAGAAAGDVVVLNLDGVEAASLVLGDADLQAGSVELTVGGLGESGAKSVTAGISDTAGNASASGALSVVYDGDTPTVAAPNLLGSSDSGSDSGDDLTNAAAPVFRILLGGAAAAGDIVTLLVDGNASASHTLTAQDVQNGHLDLQATDTIQEGSRAVSAQIEDAAGNASTSAALSVTFDRTAPAAPSRPDLAASSDSGASSGDDITSDATPTIAGTAEAGAIVRIFDGTAEIGQVTADSGGNWSFAPAIALADGTHSFTAAATDAAGNTSAASAPLALTIDTGVAGAISGLAADDGTPDSDGVTGDTTPTIAGTAEAGATVELFLADGRSLGTITADAAGTWSIQSGLALPHGSHTVHAVVTDAAGNTATTAPYGFSVDAEVDAHVITGISDDTGLSATDNLTSDSTPLIHGNAEPGSTVVLHPIVNGTLGTGVAATVNADGSWTAAPGTLADGTHVFRAQVTDAHGNVAWTGDVPVTVDTAVVEASISQVLVDGAAGADSEPLPAGTVTSDRSPRVEGAAERLALVEVYVDGTLVGSTTADETGAWQFQLSDLTDGTHTLTFRTEDAAGNTAGGPADPDGTYSYEITVDGPDAPAGPTDPLYLNGEQWHLAALGGADPTATWTDYSRIEEVWAEYSGAGVLIGIYDDGIEYSHADLAPNYDATRHVSWNGTELDPMPTTSSEGRHGTAVAGVIAAANNGEGVVGVAWGATIAGVNIFSGDANVNSSTPEGFNHAIQQMARYDVVNHSWGAAPTYLNDAQSQTTAFLAGAADAVANGRAGLGTIILKAAGNWADNAQGDANNTTRHVISVAAYDSDGDASWYTSRGANVLVSAPSSGNTLSNSDGTLSADSDLRIATTDRDGADGYGSGSWSSSQDTTGFGGTSSATPSTAGVVALMLDANPGLGWRDVQNILAYSARETGGTTGVSNPEQERVPVDNDYNGTFESRDWRPVEYYPGTWNGASNWNGGGLHMSPDYGAGAVDAHNAVRMAEVWHLFGTAQTSANEVHSSTGLMTPNLSVSGNGATRTFEFTAPTQSMDLEFVDISIKLSTQLMQEVTLELESPWGTRVPLLDLPLNDYTPAYDFFGVMLLRVDVAWTFGAHTFKGEDPTANGGVWKVHLTETDVAFDDQYGGVSGNTLSELTVDFHGSAAGSDDVYHYTDEMVTLDLNEPRDPAVDPVADRVGLTDSGGTDWLDMAAMSFDLAVDLTSGVTAGTPAGDEAIATFADATIENAIAGDGNDTLVGNGSANRLFGMRGDDVIRGGGGGDELFGHSGNDQLWGDAGGDIFFFEPGHGSDVVMDFDAFDQVSLAGFAESSFAELDLSAVNGGADTLLSLSSGDAVLFAGVSSLDAEDFLFSSTTVV